MDDLRQEVVDFIRACEALQSVLAQGGTLTPDENAVIEFSALELLSKVASGSA